MDRTEIKLDYAAGYTMSQVIKRAVARDPWTQSDIMAARRKGWWLSKKTKEMMASEQELPESGADEQPCSID